MTKISPVKSEELGIIKENKNNENQYYYNLFFIIFIITVIAMYYSYNKAYSDFFKHYIKNKY